MSGIMDMISRRREHGVHVQQVEEERTPAITRRRRQRMQHQQCRPLFLCIIAQRTRARTLTKKSGVKSIQNIKQICCFLLHQPNNNKQRLFFHKNIKEKNSVLRKLLTVSFLSHG